MVAAERTPERWNQIVQIWQIRGRVPGPVCHRLGLDATHGQLQQLTNAVKSTAVVSIPKTWLRMFDLQIRERLLGASIPCLKPLTNCHVECDLVQLQ